MTDPQQIADTLSADERDALLSLADVGRPATIRMETAARLRDRGLAAIRPDGHMDLSDVVWHVLDILRAA